MQQNPVPKPDHIAGKKVVLRPATLADRKLIFEWLTCSDLTKQMMGPPDYPDSPVPTWEQFRKDYREYFFDGSDPGSGRCFIIEANSEPVGQINHDKIYPKDRSTTLDIWMKSSLYTGRGYGSDAIDTLCQYLSEKFSCRKFILSPSARNKIAIRAYEKAGFVCRDEIPDPATCDYPDNIIMIRHL